MMCTLSVACTACSLDTDGKVYNLLHRSAVLFHLRAPDKPDDLPAYKAARKAAKDALWDYSCLAEKHKAYKLCTYNLHILNCRQDKFALVHTSDLHCCDNTRACRQSTSFTLVI
jgi:hypothetical protein